MDPFQDDCRILQNDRGGPSGGWNGFADDRRGPSDDRNGFQTSTTSLQSLSGDLPTTVGDLGTAFDRSETTVG